MLFQCHGQQYNHYLSIQFWLVPPQCRMQHYAFKN